MTLLCDGVQRGFVDLAVRGDDAVLAFAVHKVHRVGAAGVLIDVFHMIVARFRVPGDGDGVLGALSPADDPGLFAQHLAGPGGVQHLGLFLRSGELPLRHIVAELVQVPDGEGVAVEGADDAKLRSVKIPAIKNLTPANKVFAPVSLSPISNSLNPSLIIGNANAHARTAVSANNITNGFI